MQAAKVNKLRTSWKINDQHRGVRDMDSPPNDLIDLSVTIARENMTQD